MVKKLFRVFVLIFALICVFVSCDSNANTPNTSQNSTHTHSYGEWVIIKSATCTAEGSKERYCSCGEKQVTPISMTEHTFGEWKVVEAATCTEQGVEARFCSCGKKETKHIDMLAHTEIEAKGKMPTAISNGYAHGTVCQNCNVQIKEHTTLHSLKDYVLAKPSTVENGEYNFMAYANELISSIDGVFQISYSPSDEEITVSLIQYPNDSQTYITSLIFNDANATYMTYMYGFYVQFGNYQFYDAMRGQFKVSDFYTLEEFSYNDTDTTIGGSSSYLEERFNGYKSSACAMAKDIVLLLDEFLAQLESGYTTEVYGFVSN